MNMSIPVSSASLSGPVHQQNLDLFAFVLKCVAKGDSDRLSSVGLSEKDVLNLRSLSFSQLMELSDRGVRLSSYLDGARRMLELEGLSRALIAQRAPRELMVQLFRMSTRRYASERMSLGIAGGRGRPSTVLNDTALEHRIWRLWVVLADPVNPARLGTAEHWLLVAHEVPGHLRVAWALIQRWSRERGARAAFSGDRLRLSEAGRERAELDLRERHRAAMAAAIGVELEPLRQTA